MGVATDDDHRHPLREPLSLARFMCPSTYHGTDAAKGINGPRTEGS